MSANYPGEAMINIKNTEHLTIEIVKNKLVLYSDNYLERIYMDNRAGNYAEAAIDCPHFGELENLEAATLIPKKSKYRVIKVKDFKKEDKISNSVFYDASRHITFNYPPLHPGAKTVLKYREVMTEPRFISSFYFQGYRPIVECEYSITVSNDVSIGWHLFNAKDSMIKFTQTPLKNNKTLYSWRAEKVNKLDSERDAPNPPYFFPHIQVWIKSYTINGKKIPVLTNTDDLYKWYYSHLKDVNREQSKNLHNIVDSLVSGLTDEKEKVKRIYYWVQDNIKYIAFEDGMGGFIPRSAAAVCEKRFGDCKDMANILTTMMSYAGIKAYHTWIGSRHIPYRYADLSTPSLNNHMIATYINKGHYYFLDATGHNTPYSIPTAFIQGKEAMIGLDSTHYEIREVPIVPAEVNEIKDSITVDIDNNTVKGKGTAYFSGYYDIEMTNMLVSDPENTKKVVRDYFIKGSNKFLIDSVKTGDLHDRDAPFKLIYYFNIDDYIRRNEEEIYINLHLGKGFDTETISHDRALEIEQDFKMLSTGVVTLNIPKGYKVSYVPPNSSSKGPSFGFEITYTKKAGSIVQNHKLYSSVLMLKKTDFEAWNKMVKEYHKAIAEVVILKKTTKPLAK
jgi:transglutaminase-like putative cysteine protease